MAFCPNCGANVEGRFCAKCGSSVGTASAGAASPDPAQQQQWGSAGATPPPSSSAPYGGQQYPPPGATPHSAQSAGITQNVAGALAYVLGLITGIVFLVLEPYNRNRFIRFHAFQAIFLHVALIVLWMVYWTITMMLPWSLMVIGSLLSTVIWLGGIVVWVLCMVKAYNNEMFKIPVLGDLAEKQA